MTILLFIGECVASLTVIAVASLAYVNAREKRESAEDYADDHPAPPAATRPPPLPKVVFYKFCEISWHTECPICGKRNCLSDPIACAAADCVASRQHTPHLHVTCDKCKTTWFMKVKSS